MSLTQEQIHHLGKLTAIFPHTDLAISGVLESFSSLEKVDTSDISTVSRSGNPTLLLREDKVVDATIADELLNCSPQKKAAHQIVLGGIMVGE